jgi:phosphoribosylanthranilate isomerase
VPVIITAVPPAVVPLVGEIEVTVGGGVTTFNCASAIYMKSPKSLDVKVKVS